MPGIEPKRERPQPTPQFEEASPPSPREREVLKRMLETPPQPKIKETRPAAKRGGEKS